MLKRTKGSQQNYTGSRGLLQHLTDVTHETHEKDGRSNVVPEASQVQVRRHASDLRIS